MGPRALVSKTASVTASSAVAMDSSRSMRPALFTRTSMRPWSLPMRANTSSTDEGLAQSQTWYSALPPAAVTSSTTPTRFASVRASATTCAPSSANRREMARPMPVLAPVTTATRPSSFPVIPPPYLLGN